MFIKKCMEKCDPFGKGRNVLIGLIVFVISVSTCISACPFGRRQKKRKHLLLQSQIESQEQQVSDRETNFGRGGAPSDAGTGDSESSDQTAPTNNRGEMNDYPRKNWKCIAATVKNFVLHADRFLKLSHHRT